MAVAKKPAPPAINRRAKLKQLNRKVQLANARLCKQYHDYLAAVGPALDEAHALFADHNGGRWGAWCEECGLSRKAADRIRRAHDTYRHLETQGVTTRPANESQYLLISQVDAKHQADAWRAVVEDHQGDPITAASARAVLVRDARYGVASKPAAASSQDKAKEQLRKAWEAYRASCEDAPDIPELRDLVS